ncbi:unnamed protein product [Brugia timori]|uniref:Uncharacterized protein n=1 Tax=Brugia timori TaxID=42155 RepID=A0A3P7WLY3_9BILA|nr:unnamed protein product [Brugia timori]
MSRGMCYIERNITLRDSIYSKFVSWYGLCSQWSAVCNIRANARKSAVLSVFQC